MNPTDLGIDEERLAIADRLLQGWATAGEVPASTRLLARRRGSIEPANFGRQRLDSDAPVRPDALWLTASITKPVVVAAAMRLVEQGLLGLDDRLVEFVPEFRGDGKADVRIRHLMTHTSGLPDQLPDNPRLRAEHSPLSRFVAEVCRTPLLFPPGTRARYQSMGTLLLAEAVERITGRAFAREVRASILDPLGMAETYFGVPEPDRDRVVELRVDPEMVGKDWNWNSPYWLGLGAPWGGMVSTTSDLLRFARAFLEPGRVLAPATVAAMARNQFAGLPELPEPDWRCRPWGLGWRLHWPGRSDNAGDLFGPGSFGHWGATGTLLWIDPGRDAVFILLTNEPSRETGRYLARAANAYAACFLET